MRNNFAFIDSQNLNLSIKEQWRKLDWKRFRIYLKDKFGVQQAFLFIWYYPWNETLYASLKDAWYRLIFKPLLILKDGKIKWNVDAELVLHTMIQYNNFDKAILVSWDGDFYCLVEYLEDLQKLGKLIIPNERKYSSLLKKFKQGNYLFFLSIPNLQAKIWFRPDK